MNDIGDSDPQALFNYVAEQLSGRGLAYLHIIEGDTGGAAVPPFDYSASRICSAASSSPTMASTRHARARPSRTARADLIAFGKPFIGNPDLVVRLFLDAPLTPLNPETLYGGLEQGYTDYPMLRAVAPHTCYSGAERAWG